MRLKENNYNYTIEILKEIINMILEENYYLILIENN